MFCKHVGGKGSYVILGPNDYSELRRASIISARIYEEDDRVLDAAEKKSQISDAVLEKIKHAALAHKDNKRRIKTLLR